MPVIARDVQRQSRTAAAAAAAAAGAVLSDAYVAGIPSKRRKLAQGNRPPSAPQHLLAGEFLVDDRSILAPSMASSLTMSDFFGRCRRQRR